MQTKITDEMEIGVVYKKLLGHYQVHKNGSVIECTLSAKLWKEFEYTNNGQRVQAVGEKHMDPVAIGDRVQFIPTGDGTGQIVDVLPRHNILARESAKPMPGAHAFEQVIAANLDQVVPVFAAANPDSEMAHARPLPGDRRSLRHPGSGGADQAGPGKKQ